MAYWPVFIISYLKIILSKACSTWCMFFYWIACV